MKNVFVVALLLSSSIAWSGAQSDAWAQDGSRMDLLEGQIRQLTGQVEELTFAVKMLQKQLQQQVGAVETAPATSRKRLEKLAAPAPVQSGDGIEIIEESTIANGVSPVQPEEIYGSTESAGLARGAKVLGSIDSQTRSDDGSFSGQVLVPLGTEDNDLNITDPGAIEQVALAPETPQSLFEKSNEALLRRQFGQASNGFRKLLDTYPDHSLAGSAQYWLGETYYAQGDYRTAAQNFLTGYQKYPKSRRAPDSLVKLGLSLAKLGELDKACAALGSVPGEYPKAVEAKKRAQAELKRAGC